VLLRDVVPGAAFNASPFARIQPGSLPAPAAVLAPAAMTQAGVFIPIPGIRGVDGLPGPQGLAGVLVGDVDGGSYD